ncbi:hypothetical protein [Acaryochloris sp. IP29b_bin.148]|uniref:hypothetical protein n=1 Tax=Acaryochloris sp. IP29b_bin.148 TaxID=2969218 RepID=UPI002608DC9E|nr:hypothetical protein [Acaryochloris sp. IP29b_bin.148]
MTSSPSESKTQKNLIINLASWIGFFAPLIPWAWHEIAKLMKLVPIAFKQVIYEGRSISSLFLPFGIVLYLVILTICFMWILNKWKNKFISEIKKEYLEFKNTPIKTVIQLTQTIFLALAFGGSAFLISKFIIFS